MKRNTIKTETLANGIKIMFTDTNHTEFSLSRLTPEMIQRLAVHGLKQKLCDSYAGDYTAEGCESSAMGVWTNLVAGKWSAGRDGAGAMLIEALAIVTGRTISEAEAALAGRTPEEIKKIKGNPAVKAQMDKIRAERLLAKADTNADATSIMDLFN